MVFIKFLIIASAISFLIYGFTCIFSLKMVEEFTRFRIPHFRILVGILEILGGLGQILGLYYSDTLLTLSTLSLFLLMVAGFSVRLWIKDTIWQSSPALIFLLLNLYIFLNLKAIIK